MKFELPELPYDFAALEPHLSARTLEVHYTKHHKGYLEKLRSAATGKAIAEKPLEDIVCRADGDLYNNAAQVWNHTFYWNSMTPEGGGAPGKRVSTALERDFGSVDDFKQRFAEIASGQFGSGWAWLVENEDARLSVQSTSDAENPMRSGYRPLLTLDVWEHAYYLDYQNERGKYIAGFLDHLVDWDFIEQNMTQTQARQARRA